MKTYSMTKKIFILLSLIWLSVGAPVSALDQKSFAENGIYLYDPGFGCDSSSTNTATNYTVNIQDNQKIRDIYNLLINNGFTAIQASAIMGNFYAESGFNSDAHEVGNDIGYGLAQWSFSRRIDLENFAKEKGTANSDIVMQIEFLTKEYNSSYKSKLDGTSFKDSTDLARATESWMIIYEAPKMSPENDPARLNSKRIPAAKSAYTLYNNSVSDGSLSNSSCPSGNMAVAGDIVGTALNFALTSPVANGKTQKSDARDTYQKAKEEYNQSGDWTDCGVFVSTVMKASGVDTSYPVGTSIQYKYVNDHPEKYIVIKNPSVSDLVPGDILISTDVGHTILYTGSEQYPYADASLGQRVPSVRVSSSGVWMINNGAIVARAIK